LPPESVLLRFGDGRKLAAAPKIGWNIHERSP
jgi:hypothetical protein